MALAYPCRYPCNIAPAGERRSKWQAKLSTKSRMWPFAYPCRYPCNTVSARKTEHKVSGMALCIPLSLSVQDCLRDFVQHRVETEHKVLDAALCASLSLSVQERFLAMTEHKVSGMALCIPLSLSVQHSSSLLYSRIRMQPVPSPGRSEWLLRVFFSRGTRSVVS